MAPTLPRFVHLRVRSAYSLLQGALPIGKLAKLAVANGFPAIALTDQNNLFGILEFSNKLADAGIQPVAGLTMSVDFDDEAVDPMAAAMKGPQPVRPTGDVALLAMNETGYENLMKLSSCGYFDVAEVDPPHVGIDRLEEYSAGLILLTGGPEGPINRALADNRPEQAETRLDRLASIFGDRLYVELQRHGTPAERVVESQLIAFAFDKSLPLVATNDCHFATPEDFEAHDALLCIAGGHYIVEDDRKRLTPNHGLKSEADMAKLFADLPEALDNTVEIARRCHYRPLGRKPTRMKFPGYFLIVADFIKWSKAEKAFRSGPGRGSGAGSLVAWALTITDLDPLRFGLLFERFLNPERISMPDFDIDFCQDRREEVIKYVQQKYGEDRVAQIITHGKLQARAVLRDVGRVLQMPYGQVDRLCKLVPNNPANPVTLPEAIAGEPRLQEERDNDPTVVATCWRRRKLEGLYRHASTHAAGMVIGDRPLDELVPLYRDPRSNFPITQFNWKLVEAAGLVKFDFLGLKTLTVLEKAVELIKRGRGIDLDLAEGAARR